MSSFKKFGAIKILEDFIKNSNMTTKKPNKKMSIKLSGIFTKKSESTKSKMNLKKIWLKRTDLSYIILFK
jgi:hypothetical protein